jgi:hypothetical protein
MSTHSPQTLRELITEFLVDRPDGSALASEISRHLFSAATADAIWQLARDNPHLFSVAEGDHELPPEARIVRLA